MIVCVTQKAGDYMQATLWNERAPAKGRRGRYRESSEAQKQLNRRRSERRLRLLIHANFGRRDLSVRLDYKNFAGKNGRQPTPEEAAAEIRKYIRRLRGVYRRAGIALRWLFVTEIGAKSGGVHHHLLLSGGVDRDVIEAMWGHGYGNTQRLQFNEHGINGLLHYILKDPVTARRWSASRNMKRPEEVRESGRIAVRDAKYLDAHRDDLRFADKLFPGYHAVEIASTPYAAGAFGMFVEVWLYRRGTDLF